jgi:Domain of unknown function (DUF4781)
MSPPVLPREANKAQIPPPPDPPPAPPEPARPVKSGPNTDHPRQSMPPVTLQAKTPVPSTNPASTAPSAVPLNTLLSGADVSEKLKVLDTNPDWEQLPPELHRKIIGYVSLHPDEIAPISARLRQFRDLEREKERLRKDPEPDAHFEEWLQAQPEDLKQAYAKFYQPIVGGPWIDLHPLTPEQRVDQWYASHRRTSHRPLTAELVLGALRRPPPELVNLSSPALRRHFIDQALLGLDFVELEQFAKGVKGDDFAKGVKDADAWRDIVAAALLQRAVAQQSQSLREGDRADKTAVCCAANLMVVMDGAGDKLGLLLSQMPKKEAALFARALGGEKRLLVRASWFDQLLTALNSAPRTAATSAIVQSLYMQTELRDLTRAPGLAHAMAVAVAREWHPDDKVKAGVETARLEALMQGRYAELLFGGIPARKTIVFNALRSEPRITAELLDRDKGDPARNRTVTNAMAHAMIATQRLMPFGAYEEDAAWRLGGILAIEAGSQLFWSDKVPAKAMGEALAVIIADPKINSATFKAGGNAWLAPEIAEPIARLYAQGYGNDTSQSLPGFSLDNFMVGPEMGFEPTLPDGLEGRDVLKGVDVQAIAAKVAAGEPVTAEDLGDAYDLLTGKSFYDGHEEVAAIVEQINDCANPKPPLVKLLPVTFFGENGPIKCPLFRVQSGINGKGHPVYAFIDNAHRKYDSIEEWVDENHLPPGKVYYPADGHISRLVDGDMKLASADTPRTHHELEDALDTAAMVGCFAAGVVGVAVTGGTLLLVAGGVGTASGLWMGIQSSRDLVDRYTHGQSMSPLDMDALADYFGAIGGIGGGVAYFGKAARAARLGKTADFLIGVADRVAAGAGAGGLVQQGGMLIKNWDDLSKSKDGWKEVLKMLAFGGITIAGAARPRPTAEASRPPVTPTTPPSRLPIARVVPPAPAPKIVTPHYTLRGPVTLSDRPVATPRKTLPTALSKSKSEGRWPHTSPNDRLPVRAAPTQLPANAGRPAPGGASPVAQDGATPPGPSPAAAKQKPPPVDPNTRQMAGDNDGKPSEKPTGPSGPPKAVEATPPRRAGEGGNSEVEIDVARQELAKLTKAQKKAEQAYKSALPNQDRTILRLAWQRAEAAVVDARLRLRDLLARPTAESGGPQPPAVSPAPKSGPAATPTAGQAPTTLWDLWANLPNLAKRLLDRARPRANLLPRAPAPTGRSRPAADKPPPRVYPPGVTRPPGGSTPLAAAPAVPPVATESPGKPTAPSAAPLPGKPKTGEDAPPSAARKGGTSGAAKPNDAQSARQHVLALQQALVTKLEKEIAGLEEKRAGLQKKVDDTTDQSINRKRTIHELTVAEQDLDSAKQALDFAKQQLENNGGKPPQEPPKPSLPPGVPGADQFPPVSPPGATNPPAGSTPPGAASAPTGKGRATTPPVDPNAQQVAGEDKPNGGGPGSSGQPPASASRGEGPADPATAPPVDPKAELERLEKQADDAGKRTVELVKQTGKAEDELDRQAAQRRQGHEPTRDQAERALAEYRAAEAAEKKARNKARDLRAQYDSARGAIAARRPPGPTPPEGRTAQPAAEPPPRPPGGAHAAENVPDGLSGKITKLAKQVEELEQSRDELLKGGTKWQRLQDDIAAANKRLARARAQCEALQAEANVLDERIEHLTEVTNKFEGTVTDPRQPMADRIAASQELAVREPERKMLTEERDDRSRQIGGKQKWSYDLDPKHSDAGADAPRPPRPTTGDAETNKRLGLLEFKMDQASETMSKKLRDLHHLRLSWHDCEQRLRDYDAASRDYETASLEFDMINRQINDQRRAPQPARPPEGTHTAENALPSRSVEMERLKRRIEEIENSLRDRTLFKGAGPWAALQVDLVNAKADLVHVQTSRSYSDVPADAPEATPRTAGEEGN